MKKFFILLLLGLSVPFIASAQSIGVPNYWKNTGNNIQPLGSSYSVTIPSNLLFDASGNKYVTSTGGGGSSSITSIDSLTNASQTFQASSGLLYSTTSPNIHTYALNIGGSCSAGMAVTAVSATGTTSCSAFATSSGSTIGPGTSTDLAFWNTSTTISAHDDFYISTSSGSILNVNGEVSSTYVQIPSDGIYYVGTIPALYDYDPGGGGYDNWYIAGAGSTVGSQADNLAMGQNALAFGNTGSNNIAIGALAMFLNGSGNNNIAFGGDALRGSFSGAPGDNIGIGEFAGERISGNENIAIGESSIGNFGGTYFNDIGIGNFALDGSLSGSNDLGLGFYAGQNLTSASNTITIGNFVGYPVGTQDGTVDIQNLFYMTGITDFSGYGSATTTISAGNVGIATTTPDSTFDVNGNVRLEGSSTIITPSIGGALTLGTCDSVTSSVDTSVSSSTSAFISQYRVPEGGLVQPAQSYLTSSGIVTTYMCGLGVTTPTSTPVVIKIIK